VRARKINSIISVSGYVLELKKSYYVPTVRDLYVFFVLAKLDLRSSTEAVQRTERLSQLASQGWAAGNHNVILSVICHRIVVMQ